jgi:hypothetical protein
MMETDGKGDDSVARDPATPERRLSKRQQYAIELLREGLKDLEVARLVGVRQSLLRAWKENPRFRRAWALAPVRPTRPSLALMAANVFDRERRRRPEPEIPWANDEGEDDE